MQPSAINQFFSQVLSLVFLTCLALLFSGDFITSRIGEVGVKIKSFKENYPYALVVIAFVANAISGSLMSTGAFEVFYQDELLWSKIESGQLPTREALLQIVRRTIPPTLPKY